MMPMTPTPPKRWTRTVAGIVAVGCVLLVLVALWLFIIGSLALTVKLIRWAF